LITNLFQKKKNQELNQNLKKQKHPQVKKQQNQNLKEPLDTSGNLLSDTETQENTIDFSQSIASFFQSGILIACFVFLGLYLYNYVLDIKLDTLLREQKALEVTINAYGDTAEQATGLFNNITYYKKSEDSREDLADKFEAIKNSPNGISFTSIGLDADSFDIGIEGETPALFTQLIIAYFNTNEVSQIQIESAQYEKGRGIYVVNLAGKFK